MNLMTGHMLNKSIEIKFCDKKKTKKKNVINV